MKTESKIIENLVETLKDGQEGFKQAAEGVKDPQLKSLFNEYSQQRARFVTELRGQSLGKSDTDTGSSTAGALHRAWVDTKVALGGDDHTVLDWLEHGEDVAKDDYNKALGGNLPATVMEIVRRQAASVQRDHDRVRALRDQTKAA